MANIIDKKWQLPRRTLLRGMGATISLPFLEAMRPLSAASGRMPVRMACLFMPNGVRSDKWTPAGPENNPKLSPILSPLESLKSDILILSGLSNKASFTGDGHYVKAAGWLTGTTITKTTGSKINANGISMDQIAARAIGRNTKLQSLELGCERTASGVDTNVNYTRLYASHISWKTPTVPLPCEINPRVVFDRLFRPRKRQSDESSVLDLVLEDARRLTNQLGKDDRQKIEEYLESVREVERRIEHEASALKAGHNLAPAIFKEVQDLDQRISRSMGKASREEELQSMPRLDHTEHVRLMMDLIVLAFWSDSTRVSTFMFGNAVSGRNFSFLDGVNGNHHSISHHKGNGKQLDQYQRINTWHVGQYAYMLRRMKNIREGDRSLLDNAMILFGSGIRDGNKHDPHNVPIVLGGKAGGALRTGRHLSHKKDTPLCELYHGMLKRVGAPVKKIGDATKQLSNLG